MGKTQEKTARKNQHKKKKLVHSIPVHDLDEDQNYEEDPGQEDFEFFQNANRNLDFLTNLHEPSDSTTEFDKRRKRTNKNEEDSEAVYEKQPRLVPENPEEKHALLPIKSQTGFIQRTENKQVMQVDKEMTDVGEQNKEDGIKTETKDEPTETPFTCTLSVVDLYARRQQKLTQRKMRIAELSNSIIENPENNIPHLKELCSYCEECDVDVRITTRKLAMVSLLEVFKDIVPGYNIRLSTEKEKETKVSKDIRTLRDYEGGLLVTYQKYLQILEKTADQGSNKENRKRKPNGTINRSQREGLVMTAIQCMCELLTSLSHFNYRNNLIAVLVPRMNDTTCDSQISELCCETIRKLFKQDKVGQVSLETIKMISKYVKNQSYKVKPCVLQVFLCLRINDMDVLSLRESKQTKQETIKGKNKREKMMKAKMSKKDRKRHKEMKLLEKELQVTQAVEGQEKRAKLQTEMLKFVFATYFRILKNKGTTRLLSPVLEGLAKHAHLINVDFFADLMSALQTLINKQDLSLKDKLNCSLTAFKILSGQGEALNIDPRGFYCTLYTALLQLNAGDINRDVHIAIKCLDVLMKKRSKQIPIQRVSAFAKRLSTVSLHAMPNSALAFLAFVRTFFQLHPKCQKLLDGDAMGTGLFRPDVDDPELCNTDSTASWELSYLTSRHFHPTVKRLAGHVVAGASCKGPGSDLTRMQPDDFFKEYDSSEMKLNPEMSGIVQNKNHSKKFKIKEDWESSPCIEPAVRSAVEFTERHKSVFMSTGVCCFTAEGGGTVDTACALE